MRASKALPGTRGSPRMRARGCRAGVTRRAC